MSQNQRPLIAAKIHPQQMQEVDQICQQTGKSRSQILQEAIALYLGKPEVNQVNQVGERIEALEEGMKAVNQQLTQLTQAIEYLTQKLGSKTPPEFTELTNGLTELTKQPVKSKPATQKQVTAQEDGEWMSSGEAFQYLGGDPNDLHTKVTSVSGRMVGFQVFRKIQDPEEYKDFGLEYHCEQHGKLTKAKFRPIVR